MLPTFDLLQLGPLGLWCRIPDHEIGSPATRAFVADIVPLAVCAALGVMPGGTSLDNTVRIIHPRGSIAASVTDHSTCGARMAASSAWRSRPV